MEEDFIIYKLFQWIKSKQKINTYWICNRDGDGRFVRLLQASLYWTFYADSTCIVWTNIPYFLIPSPGNISTRKIVRVVMIHPYNN